MMSLPIWLPSHRFLSGGLCPWSHVPSSGVSLTERPIDRDPLDRDPPGQRPLQTEIIGQRPLGQRPSDRDPLDRDPPGQRHLWTETPWTETTWTETP